jgi:multiple antibiotic resistance protein
MSSELITHAVGIFMGFFALMNPIANTAIFTSSTANMTSTEKRQTALSATRTTFGIIFLFCILGKGIFEVFGISLPAMRVTGGILVFLVGFKMVNGEKSSMHHMSETEKSAPINKDIAISPLAMPILAGPGTIATAMNNTASGEFSEVVITVVGFALLCLITFFCFVYGERIINKLGHTGLQLISRLMGLIIAVVGIEMLLHGIFSAYQLYFNK